MMTTPWSRLTIVALVAALAAGCSCDDPADPDGGIDGGGDRDGATGMDSGPGADGATGMDAGPGADGATGMDGATADGGQVGCQPAPCGGQMYQCGNCIDDDMDGFVDSMDPDCVGACDNNEDGYDLGIPGGEVGICPRDCYYDTNQGRGECAWDITCDSTLAANQDCRPAGPPLCPMMQSQNCVDTCAPLVPNGCDCFGCCELPSGSGQFVWLGSNVGGVPTCTFADVNDPTKCFPCVPYGGTDGGDPCYNPCGRCELCLGRDPSTIPDDCFPPPPTDAGPVPDGGTPIDAGAVPTCSDGRQACGLPGLPTCPTDYYCLTGCCTFFG